MLVFIIAIYKRHHLTKVVLSYYRALAKKYGFKIVVAGSEGEVSKKIARGCHYIEVENFPVAQKNNAMMQEAQKFNPDAVVLLGSDDLICENVIKHYYKLIDDGFKHVFGFNDIYFYGLQEDVLSYFTSNKNFGAGRFFPKKVLEKINYTGWTGEDNRGLDGNNMRVLLRNQIQYQTISLNKIDGFIVDIKSGFNLSSKNIIFTGKYLNTEIMEKKIGRTTTKKVQAVKKETPKAKPSPKPYEFEHEKMYEVECTGKAKSLPKGKKKVIDGLTAKLLQKKGAITYKG